MKEIKISKRFLRMFLKCFIISFILSGIIIHFSEFEEQKKKVKRVAEKESREYTSSYNSQKRSFDECYIWCKTNPPPQERSNPMSNYTNYPRVPLFIKDEESISDKFKRANCGCPEENYIGESYYPSPNKKYFSYQPSTSPKYYSFNDFYITSIEIIPLFGNTYKRKFKNENFSLRDFKSKSKKWSYFNRSEFYVFGLLNNFHFIVFFGLLILMFVYLFKYLRKNIKIKLSN
jgi:hypothetical protein